MAKKTKRETPFTTTEFLNSEFIQTAICDRASDNQTVKLKIQFFPEADDCVIYIIEHVGRANQTFTNFTAALAVYNDRLGFT
jgi:hypothetical protein